MFESSTTPDMDVKYLSWVAPTQESYSPLQSCLVLFKLKEINTSVVLS